MVPASWRVLPGSTPSRMDWSCLPLARSTLHQTARPGFEPRVCGGGLPLRVPHPQRLGRKVCAAVLEPAAAAYVSVLICSLRDVPCM